MRAASLGVHPLIRSIAAELVKLRTLPAVPLTVVTLLAVGGLLGATLAASAVQAGTEIDALGVLGRASPFLQAGSVLLGIWPAAHEYAGRQARTSSVAVPRRGALFAGKAIAAALLVVSAVSLIVAVAVGSAWLALRATASASVHWPVDGLARLGGEAVVLAVTGLLAYGIAMLTRALVPALVVSLALVLLAPVLLVQSPALTRWLPSKAGEALVGRGTDAMLEPLGSALVLAGWVIVALGAAALVFRVRDV